MSAKWKSRIPIAGIAIAAALAFPGIANAAVNATVAGGAWFLSRSDIDVSQIIGADVSSVGDLILARWASEACPQCARGEALTPAPEIN